MQSIGGKRGGGCRLHFMCYRPWTPTMQRRLHHPPPSPPLHPLFLFLIIELNGIKSFSIGIFLCSHPFEQPEGDFNMLLPFDTAAVLEVEELRGI